MDRIYDMIIIGSGPAGLTAAIYGQRAGLDLCVLESSYVSGGQVQNTYEVENYPGLPGVSGMELSDKFEKHAKDMGAQFKRGEVKQIEKVNGLFILHTKKEQLVAKTVVIATGAHHRMLGVAGEEKLAGMGVSYCATCDGAFFRGKTVAVVGGGDVAVEDAIFLARACEKVYLVHRRDELRAAKILQDKLFALDNVELKWNSVAVEIKGEDQVEALQIKNVKTDEIADVPVDGVFVAVGILPNTAFLNGFVELDDGGYVIAGEDTKTSVPGVFVAGDVRTKALRQIITAAADGANAVTAVQEYLLEM